MDIILPRITKRVIPIKEINYSNNDHLVSVFDDNDVEYARVHRQGDEGHPSYPKVLRSVKEHGWVPDFKSRSYNYEADPWTPASLFVKNEKLYVDGGVHRYMVLRDLGYEKADYFVRNPNGWQEVVADNALANELKNDSSLQKFHIGPHSFYDEGRDSCEKALESTGLNTNYFFCGKSVLDIATHVGWWSIAAKWLGARSVCAFDNEPEKIRLANKLALMYGVEVDFVLSDFWNYPMASYDVVMCNQCIYHFNDGVEDKSPYDTLDRICSTVKETLIMYTKIMTESPHKGYVPKTEQQAKEDLKKRGFVEINIYDCAMPGGHDPEKKMIVAQKAAGLYN